MPRSAVTPRIGERGKHKRTAGEGGDHDDAADNSGGARGVALQPDLRVRVAAHRELRAVKLGRLTRIADVELERFLANKSAQSDDQAPDDGDIAAHQFTQPRMDSNAPVRITRARSLRITGTDPQVKPLADAEELDPNRTLILVVIDNATIVESLGPGRPRANRRKPHVYGVRLRVVLEAELAGGHRTDTTRTGCDPLATVTTIRRRPSTASPVTRLQLGSRLLRRD
jgi:hypothetical protein